MQSAHDAPRCGARSKRTGLPCCAPAVRGWTVCRMHGAKGGAPCGPTHGHYKHGAFSRRATTERAVTKCLIARANELLDDLDA